MAESLDVTVHVVDYGRKYLYMRYTDPTTGKHVARSTGQNTEKEAAKEAAKWEAELQEGRFKAPGKVTWKEFRAQYEDEVLNSLADKTASKVGTIFDALEQLAPVDKLAKLNSAHISKFQRSLRDTRKLAEASIKVYLSHLQAALNWANRVELLNEVPTFDMPKRAKGGKMMKGRPITLEEFERMIAKVPEQIKCQYPKPGEPPEKSAAARWQWFMRGLWWGGLRLGEALALWWGEHRNDKLTLDLSGKFPMLRIPAELDKGNEERLLPLAPEFAEMLLAVPQAERTGPVFKLGVRNPTIESKIIHVSAAITKIGTKAGVKVNTDPRTGKVKYASAHDFRRSFGERWSARVMPAVLQQMMRHESIETTMKFYVGRNADTAAATIYAAFSQSQQGNTSGNTCQTEKKSEQPSEPQHQEK